MSENLLKDADSERAVLGACVVRNAALDEISDALEPSHFGYRHHGLMFEAMRRLHAAGRPIDPVTMKAQLEQMQAFEDVGLPALFELGSGVPSSLNVAHYARVVRDKAMLRNLRDAARYIIEAAESSDAVAIEALERAEQAIYALSATEVRSEWVSGSELSAELYPVIEQLTKHHQELSGVPSGLIDLDMMTRGLQKGDLVLLGARPSQGKTAMALQMALNAAQHVNVGFFSIEMARQSVGLRSVIGLANVDGWRLMKGRTTEVEQRRIGEGLAKLGQSNFWLDESPFLSPVQARSKLRRLKSKVGALGLVVIDYVQLMAALPEHKRENKTNQVAGISRALKIMARELSVPFLVLSQFHRVPDNREPNMADLRDSGALEQDADVVLLLHRPEVYEPTPQNAGLATLIVGKHRNGPVGKVELAWRPEQMRFENKTRI
jgi:replicative DNA helicase